MAKRTKKVVDSTVEETIVPVQEAQIEETPKVKGITDYQLVYFSATFCGPCKISKPIVEKVCTEKNIDYLIFVADVEENGKEIANSFNVRSVPTIILHRGGQEVFRHIGALQEHKLQEILLNL